MRVLLSLCLIFSHLILFGASVARSEDPRQAAAVAWRPAFRSLSHDNSSTLTTLVVITNDDPFVSASRSQQPADEAPGKAEQSAPGIWCAAEVVMAYQQLIHVRPELEDQLELQAIAAGLPRELNGGEPADSPARAILALCDSEYRLLGFEVGVPDADELIAMVEDAEEVAVMRQLNDNQERSKSSELIAQRTRKRLNRMWTRVFAEVLGSNAGQAISLGESLTAARLLSIVETIDAAYLTDVRQRFALSDANDRVRLAFLEQHLETRQPWCDSLIVFAAGEDFSALWRDLVEAIWRTPPVTADTDVDELLEWVNLHWESKGFILAVEPPAHARRFHWPPLADSTARGAAAWNTAHELAMTFPNRSVTSEQLAQLIHHRELNPINLYRPSMARYLFFDPIRPQPMVVHETDSPARFTSRLKKIRSSLARQ